MIGVIGEDRLLSNGVHRWFPLGCDGRAKIIIDAALSASVVVKNPTIFLGGF
jgi:hypothetical protein